RRRRLVDAALDLAEIDQRPALRIDEMQEIVVREIPRDDVSGERKQRRTILVKLDLEAAGRGRVLEGDRADLVAVGVGEFPGAEERLGRIAELRWRLRQCEP